MRYIKILLLLILLLPVGKTCGQKFEIIGSIGYGNCAMQDLKEIQKMWLETSSLPAKITEDFPWTIQYSGEFNVQFKQFSAGFAYFFLTSGSRISYSDYSGEIYRDITVINHGFGPSIMYPFFRNDKFQFGPRLHIPLMFSRVTEKDYIRLFDESDSYSEKVYSWSFGVLPSFEARYKLSFMSFGLGIGYLFDTKGRLVQDKDMTIYLGNKDFLTTDWSGFQFNFRIGFTLFQL